LKTLIKNLFVSLLIAGMSHSFVMSAENDLRLVESVKAKDDTTAKSLLQEKVDVNVTQPDGATALAWAAYWDAQEIAGLLISAGADVDLGNDYGITPLMLACNNGSSEMVRKLLDARANPNAAQWMGVTPLMMCSRSGNTESVRMLLTGGADVNASESRRGHTALMWAASGQHLEVARLLTEYGANSNVQTRMPDDYEPRQFITYGTTRRDPTRTDVIGEDDKHPAPTSSRGGFSALMFAAREGDLDMVRLLVSAVADVNVYSFEYGNALLVAAANSHEDVALYLTENGSDPNVTDRWGLTPLHYALQDGINAIAMSRKRIPTDSLWLKPNMPALVKTLLEVGADPNPPIGVGLPPFNYPAFARTTGNSMPEIRQPGVTAFMLAAASFDIKLMHLLLSHGADPNLSTDEGTTALMVASGMGRQNDISVAQEKAAFEAASLALELGNDVNASNQDGRTALLAAAYLGANSVIQLLVENGADMNAKDRYGQTALSIAQGKPYQITGQDKRFRRPSEHKRAVDLLISLGAQAGD
jgi:ankyrin repeat protein